jgi:hypothetical protein
VTLAELNERWRVTGKPHAVGEGEEWRWHCPDCERTGHTALVLHAAMSDALAHKNHCPSVK